MSRNTTRPMFRHEILDQFGARAAKFIADAERGDDLTASVAFCRPPLCTLLNWREEGLLEGGPQEDGSVWPWRCAA